MKIGITGSEGLIGSTLSIALETGGHAMCGLDLCYPVGEEGRTDVRDAATVARFTDALDGIIHLAAVSRVVWGKQDLALCLETNIGGTRHVLYGAIASEARPWVLFASSREV